MASNKFFIIEHILLHSYFKELLFLSPVIVDMSTMKPSPHSDTFSSSMSALYCDVHADRDDNMASIFSRATMEISNAKYLMICSMSCCLRYDVMLHEVRSHAAWGTMSCCMRYDVMLHEVRCHAAWGTMSCCMRYDVIAFVVFNCHNILFQGICCHEFLSLLHNYSKI